MIRVSTNNGRVPNPHTNTILLPTSQNVLGDHNRILSTPRDRQSDEALNNPNHTTIPRPRTNGNLKMPTRLLGTAWWCGTPRLTTRYEGHTKGLPDCATPLLNSNNRDGPGEGKAVVLLFPGVYRKELVPRIDTHFPSVCRCVAGSAALPHTVLCPCYSHVGSWMFLN